MNEVRAAYGQYVNDKFTNACPKCGGPKNRRGAQCRNCRTAESAKIWKPCPDCGKRIRDYSECCRPCLKVRRAANKPRCIDCGKPWTREYTNTRCRECWLKWVQNGQSPTCSRDGCERIRLARGLCRNHYNQEFGEPRTNGRGGKAKFLLAKKPCQLCGFSRLPSNIHRVIEGQHGGRYVIGNMVALCWNCHKLVHAGLEANPKPMTKDEIFS